MKATVYSIDGKKSGEIVLPKFFEGEIREDIVQKFFEADKFIQPYASFVEAGKRQSASGTISHKRHDWKGHYGRGISRIPRKTMWRRGTQFFWVGANIPGTRGGRRAHPPKGIGKEKRLNRREIRLAFNSAFASTAREEFLKKRYSSLNELNECPIVIERIPEKTKELIEMIKKVFGENSKYALKKKTVRAGKGKLRGRKYKSNAGALFVVSGEEFREKKGFEIIPVGEVSISELYPLGRLTVYTRKAIEELNKEKDKNEIVEDKK